MEQIGTNTNSECKRSKYERRKNDLSWNHDNIYGESTLTVHKICV